MIIHPSHPRTGVLIGISLLVAAFRIICNFSPSLNDLANFSPLAAIPLFAAAYFKGFWKPFAFTMAVMFISDQVLFTTVYKNYGNGFLYHGWFWVYGSFGLICILGKLIIREDKWGGILITMVLSVLIHWIVSDIGVWNHSPIYSQHMAGYLSCLAAAIPFEIRLLLATLIYGGLLFGSFQWLKMKFPILQSKS